MRQKGQFSYIMTISICLLLTGCLHSRKFTMVDEVIIINNTAHTITQVALKIPATQAVISCNIIPQSGHCSVKFPSREAKGNPVYMQWSAHGQNYKRPIANSIIYQEEQAAKIRVEISIQDHGIIETQLLQSK